MTLLKLKPLTILLLGVALSACGGDSVDPVLSIDGRSTAGDRFSAEQEPAGDSTPVEIADVPVEPVEPAVGAATITDVVLITGQSNTLGSETTFDPVLDAPVDNFYAYTDTGWQPASLRQVWDLGSHPLMGLGDDPHNNFGFHFGKNIVANRDDRVVGIILLSAPGEGISHWDTDGFFFRKIRNKALLALNDLPQKSAVDGILWHQGETDWSRDGSNDTDLEEFPHNDYYSNKLWNLINNFRMESWFDADKPFICGETARSPVNTRLNALNRDNDNRTACVPGEGLSTYDEERVHFDAAGLRQLGANYADVYLQMTD